MNKRKIQHTESKDKAQMLDGYDHYIAIDWSKKVMAIARATSRRPEPAVIERPADIKELRLYLRHKVSYGMLKHGTEYQPYLWRTTETAQNP